MDESGGDAMMLGGDVMAAVCLIAVMGMLLLYELVRR